MRNIEALSHQWYALEWQLEMYDTCRRCPDSRQQTHSGDGPTQPTDQSTCIQCVHKQDSIAMHSSLSIKGGLQERHSTVYYLTG